MTLETSNSAKATRETTSADELVKTATELKNQLTRVTLNDGRFYIGTLKEVGAETFGNKETVVKLLVCHLYNKDLSRVSLPQGTGMRSLPISDISSITASGVKAAEWRDHIDTRVQINLVQGGGHLTGVVKNYQSGCDGAKVVDILYFNSSGERCRTSQWETIYSRDTVSLQAVDGQ